ncbi:MAG: GlsB/YeaQ/YmgE family stress response membrane protein [Deltaproteobacteria bacterium]|nr:GlsB/YeaQ/YmgE family stress response membrane protein [Myxococcales bacterium]MDP3218138.1 GlsB/YeaQ/YmgE family stress response membrane protein [Deltaproteobacteria bacterium]
MNFLLFAIFGLVVGALAKLLMPGRDPGGFIITAVIGMVGSLLGAFLGRALGMYGDGTQSAGWIMSIIGSIVLLGIYRMVVGSRATA